MVKNKEREIEMSNGGKKRGVKGVSASSNKSGDGMKKCPRCGKMMSVKAKACRCCGHVF